MTQLGAMAYLVRHADAGDKLAWRGAHRDRPLSVKAGARRPGDLVDR